MNRSFLLAVGIVPWMAACGGPQTPPAPPATTTTATTTTTEPTTSAAPSASAAPSSETTTTASASASAAPAAWKDMSHEQKLGFMKTVFMPKMKAEFVGFDAKMFEKMNCMTCHGDGAKDGSFKMPNPQLPKLKVDAGFKTEMTKHPAITKFMMEKVVGTAAGTLGLPPYDPKTHEGFGCFGCHTPAK
jgi:hypothetical protein